MENSQHPYHGTERRVMSRIDAALRMNYQIISDDIAFNDPYDANFILPRYFLLLAELDQFDHALKYELEQLNQKDQQIARILSLFNQKLGLLNGAFYDATVNSLLPAPQQVNFSESGLSFFSDTPLTPGKHLHITLSHPEQHFHIAAIAQISYSEPVIDTDGFRIGAIFTVLHPKDKLKLAHCVAQHGQINTP